MSLVSIEENAKTLANIEKVAVGMALFFDYGLYPDFLGHHSGFERNANAVASNLAKFHIAIIPADFIAESWKKNHNRGEKRTTDNFVLYVNHYFENGYYQILDILTPEAHSCIDHLLPHYVELAERFNSLRKADLEKLEHYTVNHSLAKNITLTS